MLRTTTIVCLIALAVHIFALPEYIENLERDLSLLPEEYQHIAQEFNSKRAADNERDTSAYCCTNWQHVNNDEVVSKVVTSIVQKTHTIIVGYQDCHGNLNPERPPVPIPTATARPIKGQTTPSTNTQTTTGCMWTPLTKTETYTTIEYTTITHLVPNSHTFCAPADYKCCAGYVMLNNNCIHGSSVNSLEYLIALGLIGGVGKK
ncbi:unnamed protein product [Adineta steineri]|uniref:Uncharacterized protein n=1 Tax=Adineta steineri TaxID=433720 RepID=A0A815CZR6_9BILA|nr:unnamed protein product [Adineta steineri]CAF1571384.1 unnamed protein product [Adineta steineri]